MRFLLYEIDDKSVAANTPPSPQLMAEMGKLVEETTKAGILLATGGLGAKSTHIRSSGKQLTVTDGPFTETKELTGGFALIEVKSRDEAIEWGKRFRKIVGDGESVIQEVFGGDGGPG
ncbi:MAG TPA: YciI family protein [Candidatus Limnocylindria bacterium]|nr:YciI family protein [Candidatus Limnocylindria bacterium]